MAVTADGSVLIADTQNHRIRRVAPNGIIFTVAGDGTADLTGDGGPASAASLNRPTDVAVASDGSYYIADSGNHRIRRVAPNGVITTVAGTVAGLAGDGGPAIAARLNGPREFAFLADGSLLVVDSGNHRVRRLGVDGLITTVAGTTAGFSGDGGPATSAQLSAPRGVTVTADGGYLIADAGNHRVRKVGADGLIRTVAGTGAGFAGDGGLATFGALATPSDVAEISNGGFLVVDTANNRIRRVTPLGAIFTISGASPGLNGDGGPASAGLMNGPAALQFAPGSGILVGDTLNHRIRRISDIGRVPDPEVVRSFGVRNPLSGTVTVQPRTTSTMIPLREDDLAPNGSEVDATSGRLEITVRDPSQTLFTAEVSRGKFSVTQPVSNISLADLRLTERLDGCRRGAATSARTNLRSIRRLRVRVRGRYRTIGRYASAIARGTAWTIVDGCDRTVIKVTEGRVRVRNRRTGRFFTIRAGQTRTVLASGRVV
jgi:hypothetical protein